MRYLLDVSAVIAMGFDRHEFHDRAIGWLATIVRDQATELATCSVTELGFIRILVQAPQYGLAI